MEDLRRERLELYTTARSRGAAELSRKEKARDEQILLECIGLATKQAAMNERLARDRDWRRTALVDADATDIRQEAEQLVEAKRGGGAFD